MKPYSQESLVTGGDDISPFERQKQFPQYDELLHDWPGVRKAVRKLEDTLIKQYKLIDLEPKTEASRPVI